MVQIVYQHHFYPNAIDYYLDQDYEFRSHDMNEDLYKALLQKMFVEDYDPVEGLKKFGVDITGLSLICLSVLKVAMVEFELGLIDGKLIIAEYVKVSHHFLEDYEVKTVNKILADVLNRIKL